MYMALWLSGNDTCLLLMSVYVWKYPVVKCICWWAYVGTCCCLL